MIKIAIAEYEFHTCIRWTENFDPPADYVSFVQNDGYSNGIIKKYVYL